MFGTCSDWLRFLNTLLRQVLWKNWLSSLITIWSASWQLSIGYTIPANFFEVKCVRFFVSREPEFRRFTNGFQRFAKISEDFRRSAKMSDDFWRLPMKDFLTTSKNNRGVERFSTTSKQGKLFPNKFQLISKVPKMFQRLLEYQQKINSYLIVFKELHVHSLLSVKREKLVWKHEITILELQA